MSNPQLDTISEYCINNNIDFPVRNQAYAIYAQELEKTIENHKQNNNGQITPRAEQTLQNAMISENSIRGYVNTAEVIISEIKQTAVEPYRTGKAYPVVPGTGLSPA